MGTERQAHPATAFQTAPPNPARDPNIHDPVRARGMSSANCAGVAIWLTN
jgi:hypothetical protein